MAKELGPPPPGSPWTWGPQLPLGHYTSTGSAPLMPKLKPVTDERPSDVGRCDRCNKVMKRPTQLADERSGLKFVVCETHPCAKWLESRGFTVVASGAVVRELRARRLTEGPASEVAVRLTQTRQRIRACRGCSLASEAIERGWGPVPSYGPWDTTWGVLGEAPGKDEERQGRPFVGRSGRLIRKYLRSVGLDPDAGLWFNSVCCMPTDGGRIRPPDKGETAACKANLYGQVTHSRLKLVLIAGGAALNAVKPGTRITAERGNPFEGVGPLTGRVFFPTFHPAYILRNAGETSRWKADLAAFAERVRRLDADGAFWDVP